MKARIESNVITRGIVLTIAFTLISISGLYAATTVNANSAAAQLNKPNGNFTSDTWSTDGGALGATINWVAGDDYADLDHVLAKGVWQSEKKFNAVKGKDGTLHPAGKNWANFNKVSVPGALGSYDINLGRGSSNCRVVTCWTNWHVVAAGVLGTAKKGVNPPTPSYSSHTEGDDPWRLTQSDFSNAGLRDGSYALFFAAGLDRGSYFSKNGQIGFEVSYQTADGISNLLTLTFNSSGVSATSDASGLQLYLVPGPDVLATQVTGSPISLDQLQAMLAGDVSGQVGAFELGFYLPNIPIPTTALADGSLAEINVDATADDSRVGGTAPEPTSLLLLGSGILGLSGMLRKRLLT